MAHQAIKSDVFNKVATRSHKEKCVKFELPVHSNTYKTLDWHDDQEFMLDGQMYDVISLSIRNNIVYITCFHDFDDTKLWSDWLWFVDLSSIIEKIVQQLKKMPGVESVKFILSDLLFYLPHYDFYIIKLFPGLNVKHNDSGYNFFVFQPPELIS